MSTALRTYYRGANLVTLKQGLAQERRTYHFDHQGTTECLTDSTGAVTDRFACDAWGVQVEREGASINRSWFVGRRSALTHRRLVYVRSNVYDPTNAVSIESSFQHFSSTQTGSSTPLAKSLSNPGGQLSKFGAAKPRYVPPLFTTSCWVKSHPEGECGSAYSEILLHIFGRRINNQLVFPKGWIIQHVKRTSSVKTCDGRVKSPTNNRTLEYWEAWEVQGGSAPVILRGGPLQLVGNIDRYSSEEEDDCTYGQVIVNGEIVFHEGPLNVNGWGVYQITQGYPGIANAPTNIAGRTPPLGVSWANAIPHRLHVHWRCCPDSRFIDVHGTPC